MKKLIDKRYLLFIATIFIIGVLFGLIFIFFIDTADKLAIKSELISFINSIKNNTLLKWPGFLNSFKINLTYILLISIFSLVFALSFIVLFIIFYKGVTIGFSISNLIYTYKSKGLLYSILIMFPHEFINIAVLFIYSYFALKYSYKLYKSFKNKETLNVRKFYTNFSIISLIFVFISSLSSFLEIFINYYLIKLFV